MTDRQYSLFSEIEQSNGGAALNTKPVMGGRKARFYDYDGFVAKFNTEQPKTTDDCYTPNDVFDGILGWLDEEVGLDGRQIVRPFYPGGDYENEAYPDGCVVVDNPPFSIFLKIVRFYVQRGIPFFLFGPAQTILNAAKICTVIMSGRGQIIFANGAKVNIGYASNLFGDVVAMTAPALGRRIAACPSQRKEDKRRQQYRIPDEVISFSKLQTMANAGMDFELRRADVAAVINDLDLHPKGMFGTALLVSRAKTEEARAIRVVLSERERRMVDLVSAGKKNDATT